ncbi:hypothetical protein [Evansella halocellulosilytica]|uniref:hypothetical protein n=1 Tax=Evansella halocellulosilytica TaxID=2011013 RepID=UPI000BB72015|nr:hypothetical protein [Evansella halocellulosilytica]
MEKTWYMSSTEDCFQGVAKFENVKQLMSIIDLEQEVKFIINENLFHECYNYLLNCPLVCEEGKFIWDSKQRKYKKVK